MKKNLPFVLSWKPVSNLLVAVVFLALPAFVPLSSHAQQSNALNFTGSGYAAVTGAELIDITGSYTKEAWIRISDASGSGANARNILSEGGSSFAVYDDGKLQAGQSYTYTIRVKDNTPLTVGQWYHVAVTYDAASTTMRLYKDGVQVSVNTNVPAPFIPVGQDAHSTIGGLHWNNKYDFTFQGDIAELRVWNYARTVGEIALTAHCSLPANTEGLTAYYRFNEGIAGGDNTAINSLNDLSGNGYSATLGGFALTGTTSNFIGGFSEIGGECTVMPVTLHGFQAKAKASSVMLSWQTATEVNNKGFTVQRSDNGNSNWEDIAFIAGAGNSATVKSYQYEDVSPINGVNYYRLKQTDFDNKTSVSSIVSAKISGASVISLYPTNASSTVTLKISDNAILRSPYIIYDNAGRAVQKGLILNLEQQIDVSGLGRGMYIIKTADHGTLKFFKN